MAQADKTPTTIPLSRLFRDPYLRAIFSSVEKDNGAAFAVPVQTPKKPTLRGGAARSLEFA